MLLKKFSYKHILPHTIFKLMILLCFCCNYFSFKDQEFLFFLEIRFWRPSRCAWKTFAVKCRITKSYEDGAHALFIHIVIFFFFSLSTCITFYICEYRFLFLLYMKTYMFLFRSCWSWLYDIKRNFSVIWKTN